MGKKSIESKDISGNYRDGIMSPFDGVRLE